MGSAWSTCIAGTPSRSAIVCGGYLPMSGYHLLEIEGYSRSKDLPPGKLIASDTFDAGGCSWHMSYYPNGNASSNDEYISVFLNLHEATPQTVTARAKFSLIDHATGEPEPSHVHDTGRQEFTAKGSGCADFVERAWLEKSTCLKDDCFTVRCDVVVYKEIQHRVESRRADSPSSSVTQQVVVPPSNLNSQIADLLGAKETADVTFRIGGEVFVAHRCVLAARSPVFKAELFSAMKESRRPTVIGVDDMEANVFGDLLRFIYTDTVPDRVPDTTREEEIAMAQHMLVAADRYDLGRLKLICEDKLCKLMDVSSVATILTLAEQHSCHGLKKACFQFLGSPSTLSNALATEGFDHLERSCPSVFKELFSKVVHMHINRDVERRSYFLWRIRVLVVLCVVLYWKGGSVFISCVCFFLASFVLQIWTQKTRPSTYDLSGKSYDLTIDN